MTGDVDHPTATGVVDGAPGDDPPNNQKPFDAVKPLLIQQLSTSQEPAKQLLHRKADMSKVSSGSLAARTPGRLGRPTEYIHVSMGQRLTSVRLITKFLGAAAGSEADARVVGASCIGTNAGSVGCGLGSQHFP